MSKKEKSISALIIFLMTAVFLSAAAYVSLNYNSWFVQDESFEAPVVSFSDTRGNRINLRMNQSGITSGISDETLAERNIYEFPTGDSPYFIYVEKGTHTLSVFEKDEYGLYTRKVFTWSTATGKTSGLTPVGTFTVGAKEEWHVWPAKTVSPYATKYYEKQNRYGGLYIHGPIYAYREFYSLFSNTAKQIGTNCSSGCLRTETEAAYFVYEMCPEGTLVKIVEGSPLGFTPNRVVYPYNQTFKPSLDRFFNPSKLVQHFRFAEESHTMRLGDQFIPEILYTPEDVEFVSLNWTTNNPSIVKISGDSIWAVGIGSAMITATTTDGVLSDTMLINVTVHDVDTSLPPPDVGGKMTEDDSNIDESFVPLKEDLLFLEVKGEKFSINQSVKPLLKCLGYRYIQKPPVQSCAYKGYDRFFQYNFYPGICNISTVPSLPDGGDAICEVEFIGNTGLDLQSSKGIKWGDSLSDIKRAYGKYYTEIRVDDEKKPADSYIRITYWAGTPGDPATPSLYFTLDVNSLTVKGMGIYSARNMG